MAVEALGEALSYGWRVTARCAAGKQDGMHRHKECVHRAELDMETAAADTRCCFMPVRRSASLKDKYRDPGISFLRPRPSGLPQQMTSAIRRNPERVRGPDGGACFRPLCGCACGDAVACSIACCAACSCCCALAPLPALALAALARAVRRDLGWSLLVFACLIVSFDVWTGRLPCC
jgi:hypothetical protein